MIQIKSPCSSLRLILHHHVSPDSHPKYQACPPIIRFDRRYFTKLSELLEIPDPLVSNSETSCFAELGSAGQILALYIGYKPEHLEWQTETYDFFRTYNFS
jgi:hypothetical protein